jgi:uncharacterized surface protein with fasciclin (FAS1) repeats
MLKTRGLLAALGAAGVLLLSACGGSDNAADPTTPTVVNPMTSTSASMSPTTTSTSTSPSAGTGMTLVGKGCADYAKANPSGAGSVDGMAKDPVATAASNNPLLTTLVKAVSGQLNPKVNLVSTLNGGQFTVFAPVDSAFGAIDAATLASLQTDAGAAVLSTILTYHVVPGQIAPDKLTGMLKTVEGEEVSVTGSGDTLKIGTANVLCGGVKTANATVYLIDQVLLPPTVVAAMQSAMTSASATK